MDFSKLRAPKSLEREIDPIKIFERLPNLPNTPNDLWRGQAKALDMWNDERDKSDVLLSLNTGAGKTLVGLLVAQSLVNENIRNVIYVCATIDLVHQTARQAKDIGLECTTRIKSMFSNDLFQSEQGFCITTYHALFNGFSYFKGQHFPGAVIFDDAHVAEKMLRDSLNLTISRSRHPKVFNEVAGLFRPHFRELRKTELFEDSLTEERSSTVMAAPGGLAERRDRLVAILKNHGIKEDNQLKYPFAHLADRLDCCAILFSRGTFELAPPFLPSLALDVFERPLRRIYLSATLKSKTDFVRAFGRLPNKVIEPDNDAGNGERLILYGRNLDGQVSTKLVTKIREKHKILIATKSYLTAKKWHGIAITPTRENFSAELDIFRRSDKGAFVLVSRVDGIDLPHNTCRVMVLDSLPSGTSLIERFQWEYLNMFNLHATRIANRLVQLFGRINRGRNDYGAFLIAGDDINTWLNNDKNIALLPPLLQRQILLGRTVQEDMNIKKDSDVMNAIDAVLSREGTWIGFYGDNIQHSILDPSQAQQVNEDEKHLIEAAEAEARYAAAMWNGDHEKASNALDTTIENTVKVDALLSGWHSVWLGAAYELEGDIDSAHLAYQTAVSRLGNTISLPLKPEIQSFKNADNNISPFAVKIEHLVSLESGNKFQKEVNRYRLQLSNLDEDGASSAEMEEATRSLGELLGYVSVRPDNDHGTGPDVLWLDDTSSKCIAFELKTSKGDNPTYWKKDVLQGHDHITWIASNHKEAECLGLLFVGPSGTIEQRANPTEAMWVCAPEKLVSVRDRLFALVEDIRRMSPAKREVKTREFCDEFNPSISEMFERLKGQKMKDMPRRKA